MDNILFFGNCFNWMLPPTFVRYAFSASSFYHLNVVRFLLDGRRNTLDGIKIKSNMKRIDIMENCHFNVKFHD